MALWLVSDAVSRLRSLLNDGPADKFVFKSKAFPPPDGLTRRFFAGHTHVVPDSLSIYLNGAEISPSGTPDYVRGSFDLVSAPAPSGNLQATYYHQWFTDAELENFLQSAAENLRYTAIDVDIDQPLRPVLLNLAACDAWANKAGEYAAALVASAAGYSVDRSKSHPNFRALSEAACKRAQELLDSYIENPLSANSPQMAFVSFRLPIYQPKT
jgi:hypothetical protein